jgi:hypothetical protein
MNIKRQRRKFVDKVLLIGITVVDENGSLIDQFQTNGSVTDITDEGIIQVLKKDGSIFQIPFDKETISKAAKGKYTEHSTGEVIIDPDYLVSWEIISTPEGDLEELKQKGYEPKE